MITILSFKKEKRNALASQTISQYAPYFYKKIAKNGNGLCRVEVPNFSYGGTSQERMLCNSGHLSIYEVNESLSKKKGQENLSLKISDRIKDKIPPQRLDVVKIKDLNSLIALVKIKKDTRFNAWYVTVQLNDKGTQFYNEATYRLITKRAAFVLDSGFWGKEILSAQVIREVNRNGIFSLPVNSFQEAQDIRDILSWGAYMMKVNISS